MEALILSYGLDTNGQNFRFTKAAEKFGRDKDVLSALAIGITDPAGVVSRFQIAADKLGTLEIRSAHRAEAYFAFPNDIHWDRKTEPVIREMADRADVIHLNNSHAAYTRLRLTKKPALLHHHGSMFRSDPQKMLDIATFHRMTQAVSTIDLQRPDPKRLHWLPTAYDVDTLLAYREAHRREPDGKVRIVHCPTNRIGKSTDLFIAVTRELVKEIPLEVVIVENKTWAETMAVKATADIVYDQLLYGYGCNAVEAWAMGIPVIAGADDWTLDKMFETWGQMPFLVADEQTLKHGIRKMVGAAQMRADWAAFGMAHVRKYHDEKPALEKLAELYHEAIRTKTRIRIPGKGVPAVTFRTKGKQVYDLEGQPIVFPPSRVLKVNDPDIITRLRTLAKRPSAFGIEEVA
jgi:hypothetical protein